MYSKTLAEEVQRTLKSLGHDLGRSGPGRDGVDGDIGDVTLRAVLLALGKPAEAVVAENVLAIKTGLHTDEQRAAFFASIRKSLFTRGISQSQVDGILAKLRVFSDERWPISYAAAALATSYWETAHTMQPIEEYGKGRGRKYGVKDRNGQIPYGRGDVQLTWPDNYERADRELGLNGTLIRDYSKALDPDISARIMVRGMTEGWFTGKKLSDYLPARGPATREQFKQTRRIINGVDHWTEIADIAVKFQEALKAGKWDG